MGWDEDEDAVMTISAYRFPIKFCRLSAPSLSISSGV